MKRLLCTTAVLIGMFLPLHRSSAEQIAIPKPEMSYAARRARSLPPRTSFLSRPPRSRTTTGRPLKHSASWRRARVCRRRRRDACFLLCLTEFSALKFQDAARDSGQMFDMLQQRREAQEGPARMLAKQIVDQCAAGQVENVARLRDVIYACSLFRGAAAGRQAGRAGGHLRARRERWR